MSCIPPEQATSIDRLSLPSAALAYTDALTLNRLYAGPRTADWVAQSCNQTPLTTHYTYERTPPPICRPFPLAPSLEIAEPRRPYFPRPILPPTRTPSSPRIPPITYIPTPASHRTPNPVATPILQQGKRGFRSVGEDVRALWKKGTGIFSRGKSKPKQPQPEPKPMPDFDKCGPLVGGLCFALHECSSEEVEHDWDICCTCLGIWVRVCAPCLLLYVLCYWLSEGVKKVYHMWRGDQGEVGEY